MGHLEGFYGVPVFICFQNKKILVESLELFPFDEKVKIEVCVCALKMSKEIKKEFSLKFGRFERNTTQLGSTLDLSKMHIIRRF